jgi:hypothetical protein
VGLAAAIATLAASTLSARGVGPRDPHTLLVLGLVWLLAALGWWLERTEDLAWVARTLDRRSGLGGALATAFEVERDGSRSSVGALLVRRVAPRVSVRRFLEGEARASLVVLAAPLFAAALLGAALEFGEDVEGPASASAIRSSTAMRAGELRAVAGRLAEASDLSPADAAALQVIADRAARLAVGGEGPPDSIERLQRELDELVRRLGDPQKSAPGTGVALGGGDGTMGGPDPRTVSPKDASMPDTTPLSPPADPSTPFGEASRSVGIEPGVGAPRWWPRRYDAVVQRWLEARRLEPLGPPR